MGYPTDKTNPRKACRGPRVPTSVDARFLLAAVLLAAGAIIAVAGATPQSALSPTQAHDADPGAATVKGTVAHVDAQNGTFTLTDETSTLTVHHSTPLPAAVEPEATLVAKGTLTHEETVGFHADEIQVGCPSQYGE